jgi:hypothetical protein
MSGILAIDPGTIQSAWVDVREGVPLGFGIMPNEALLENLRVIGGGYEYDVVVLEKVESYGMAVGREVFDTVHWNGRFTEAAHPIRVVQIPRREVKLYLCGSPKANDSNIRAAIIDRYGGIAARGTKKSPGVLYGISKDVWSALALALTYTARENRHA